MAAPAKTTDEAIARAARRIIAGAGLEALSMQAVAAAVGVRAPSLYKRYPDRDALVAEVARRELVALREALESAGEGHGQPRAALLALGDAYRAFAHQRPRLYPLLVADRPATKDPVFAERARAVEPLFAALGSLVDAAHLLDAARLVTAFVHGFVSMELRGSFQLGGEPASAYRFGLGVLVDGLRGLRRTGRKGPAEADAPGDA